MSAVEVQDVSPDEVNDSLRLILAKNPHSAPASPAEVEFLIAYLDAQQLSVSWHLVLKESHTIHGSCLAIRSPGRTGMVLVSPIQEERFVAPMLAALGEIRRRARAEQLIILQILRQEKTRPMQHLLEQAGYEFLAELCYMTADVKELNPTTLCRKQNHQTSTIRFVPYTECDTELFKDTLSHTYQNSLDCPRLSGVRTIDDIIASHRSTGIHRPDWWYLIYDIQYPVGVLLLTQVPLRPQVELIYLGLSPQARGRGMGRHLVQHALSLTRLSGRQQLLVAVDQQNTYAMRIYQSMGFIETDRREAWINVLNQVSV